MSKPPIWHKAFLNALARTGNVAGSAELVGMSRAAAYKARRTNKRFAAKWEEAIDVATDAMELEARRRGMSGVAEPVYYQGQQVGHVQKYSDVLLIFLLKAHRPEKYRDHHVVETSAPGGGPIQVEHQVDFKKILADPEARHALELIGRSLETSGVAAD